LVPICGRQGQDEHLHHCDKRQRDLGGRGGEQVYVRVVPAPGLAEQREVGGPMLEWRGIVRVMVLRCVVVCEVVTHLGEERSYPQEKGERNSGKARATQVSHRGKITRKQHA
jgi:hypothetical protein